MFNIQLAAGNCEVDGVIRLFNSPKNGNGT